MSLLHFNSADLRVFNLLTLSQCQLTYSLALSDWKWRLTTLNQSLWLLILLVVDWLVHHLHILHLISSLCLGLRTLIFLALILLLVLKSLLTLELLLLYFHFLNRSQLLYSLYILLLKIYLLVFISHRILVLILHILIVLLSTLRLLFRLFFRFFLHRESDLLWQLRLFTHCLRSLALLLSVALLLNPKYLICLIRVLFPHVCSLSSLTRIVLLTEEALDSLFFCLFNRRLL